MSGIFAVFTLDCVSFCEVSSHAANSKGRRLRFLGSHRRIVMSFYLILFAQTVFAISLTSLSLFHCCSPVSLLPISQEAKPHCGLRQRRSAFLLRGCGQSRYPYAENGLILSSEVVSTNGQGHGALVGFLVQHQVNVVLCGGIGAGAQAALAQAGIQLFGGISGSADPLPQIIWLVGLFLTPTPTAIIMPTKQSTPAAPIPATRTKVAVPGAATDQKS